MLSTLLLKCWMEHLWQCPKDVSAVGIYYFRRKCTARPQVEMGTRPYFSSDQLQFLVSRHGLQHVYLKLQNFKMHSDLFVPPPPAPTCLYLSGHLFSHSFSFSRLAALNPGALSPSLSQKKTLRPESATAPVGKFSGGIRALLLLAIMRLIRAFLLFVSFLPFYKCLLEMQISVFWYFKHLNLFPQACSRRRVFYLFWDPAFSLNLPLLAVLLCLLAICSYQAK